MSLNFGGARRVYGSKEAKEFYDEMVDLEKQLPSHPVMFSLAATAGLLIGKREKLKNRQGELINMYSFEDAPLFEIILARFHPELTPKERLQYLEEYAEAGVSFLRNHREKYRSIDVAMLIHDLQEAAKDKS